MSGGDQGEGIHPFIKEGRWAPIRTGDYSTDCAAGRDCAETMLKRIKTQGNPALFGSVIRAIVAAGIYDGVETGFCSVVGIRLIGVEPIAPQDGSACQWRSEEGSA